MITFNYFQAFVIGACIGSFLNVIVYRFPHNLSIVKLRSFCPKCKKSLTWKENIPLISWLIQRGKCINCYSSISYQYPLVELATGILFVFFINSSPSIYSSSSGSFFNIFFSWIFLSLLICISLIDINNFWIPQGLINFGFISGLLGLISMVYGLPIFKNGTVWFRLRDVPGLKIFLIASIWALVTQGLPDLMSRQTLNYLALFERFLFIFAITIPFDIRDLRFDKFNLVTVPQYFGVRKARWIGIGALLIAEFVLVYRFFFEGNLNLWGAIAIYLTYELSAFLIYKSHPNLKERYTTIGVEGLPILMGLIFFVSQRV